MAMRLADQPVVEEQIRVAAGVDRVWAHVVDIGLVATVSEELVAVEWLGRGPALGAKFVGTNRNRHFGEWQTTSTVIALEPPREFGWVVGDVEQPNTTWWFTLEAAEETTTLAQRVKLGVGPSGLTVAITQRPDKEDRILQRRLEEFRANMRANLEEIKRRAEAG